jgi:hypothetical protein
MSYIEIKTRKIIDGNLAQKIIAKKTVISVLTTGKITKPAKALFDDADITWAENIPESEFMEREAQEEG